MWPHFSLVWFQAHKTQEVTIPGASTFTITSLRKSTSHIREHIRKLAVAVAAAGARGGAAGGQRGDGGRGGQAGGARARWSGRRWRPRSLGARERHGRHGQERHSDGDSFHHDTGLLVWRNRREPESHARVQRSCGKAPYGSSRPFRKFRGCTDARSRGRSEGNRICDRHAESRRPRTVHELWNEQVAW